MKSLSYLCAISSRQIKLNKEFSRILQILMILHICYNSALKIESSDVSPSVLFSREDSCPMFESAILVPLLSSNTIRCKTV